MSDNTIPCPFCAEQIKAEAIRCRHCQADLKKPDHQAASAGCAGCLSLFLFLFLVGLCVPSSNTGQSLSTSSTATTPKTVTVTYKVGGSTSEASVTLQNASGGTEQKKVSVPWSTSFTGKPGQFVYLSAQNQNDYGTIEASIELNGKTVKSATSDDDYGIASVSGSL